MLTVTAIAADHLSSTFTNYIRAMANYRDCPQTTHSSHSVMDLSFPIPVIGKVALSTPLQTLGPDFCLAAYPESKHSILASQLALPARSSRMTLVVSSLEYVLESYQPDYT
jgi:hypothetical protein